MGHRGDLLRVRSRVGIVVGLIRRDSRAGRRGRLGLRRRSDLLHRRLSGRDVERRRGRPAVHGQTHADRGVADDRPRSRRPAAGLDGDRDLRPADRLWSARRHARRDDERGRRADRAAPGHADFRAAARRSLRRWSDRRDPGQRAGDQRRAVGVGNDRGSKSRGRRRPGGAGDRAGRRRQGGRPDPDSGARPVAFARRARAHDRRLDHLRERDDFLVGAAAAARSPAMGGLRRNSAPRSSSRARRPSGSTPTRCDRAPPTGR